MTKLAAQTSQRRLVQNKMARRNVFMKRLLLISLFGGFAVSTWAATNYPSLTATELLDKFAASQEHLKSFVASYEETAQTDFPNAAPPIKGGSTTLGDVRVDFPRVAERTRDWGAFGGTKAQPRYSSLLTDGHLVLYYGRQSDAGSAMVMSQFHPPTGVTCVTEAMGRSVSLRACLVPCWPDSEPRFDRKIRNEQPSVSGHGWNRRGGHRRPVT